MINPSKVNLGNLESELWKKNIVSGPRNNKDYLDVSTEDFTKNTSLSVEGKEITPSSKKFLLHHPNIDFNVFRDSLRQNS